MAPVHQNRNQIRKLKASSSIRENQRFRLLSLPNELLSEIVLRVSEASSKSLAFTKLSCKGLQKTGESKCIYQHACLKDFPIVPLIFRKEHGLFFNKCISSKNPEALYRQGVMDYFGHQSTELALKHLKEAADNGHEGASYMMAIIFMCCKDDNDQNQKGVNLLLDLKTSSKTKVKEYRASLQQIMREISWTPNLFNIHMPHEEQIKGNRSCTCRGWKNMEWNADPDEIRCEACLIDEEVEYMCSARDNKTTSSEKIC